MTLELGKRYYKRSNKTIFCINISILLLTVSVLFFYESEDAIMRIARVVSLFLPFAMLFNGFPDGKEEYFELHEGFVILKDSRLFREPQKISIESIKGYEFEICRGRRRSSNDIYLLVTVDNIDKVAVVSRSNEEFKLIRSWIQKNIPRFPDSYLMVDSDSSKSYLAAACFIWLIFGIKFAEFNDKLCFQDAGRSCGEIEMGLWILGSIASFFSIFYLIVHSRKARI